MKKLIRKKIEYAGYKEDGTKFDQNEEGKPLELVVGRYTVMEPIVDAIENMDLWEEADIDIPCEKAYGEYDPKALLVVPRSYISEGDKLEKGQRIIWHSNEKPNPVAVLVADCDEDSVQLDFNHPLAGENLKYWIRVVDVQEETVF